MNTLTIFFLAFWGLALGITIWGTWFALRHFSTPPKHLDAPFALYPVTILKPLKGAESGLRENLDTFFRLNYPKYEVLFTVADARDPACAIVRELLARYPNVPARLIVGHIELGPNPKVNNMALSYAQAKYDLLLISDSNIRVAPDYIKRLVANLDAGVGMMTSIVAGQNADLVGGQLEACYLNTFYARGMAMAFSAGHPVVMGKSMLFRKSTIERFGGLAVLARYLAEDYMAGEAVQQLGLKVIMASDPVVQHIGRYTFKDFWSRHIRWGRIRKIQAPLAFAIEPFLGCLAAGIQGAIAFHYWFGTPMTFFLALHLLIWSSCDFLMIRRLSRKIEILLPLYWFIRELLAVPIWFHIASGNTVLWRGQRLKLQAGGLIEVPNT